MHPKSFQSAPRYVGFHSPGVANRQLLWEDFDEVMKSMSGSSPGNWMSEGWSPLFDISFFKDSEGKSSHETQRHWQSSEFQPQSNQFQEDSLCATQVPGLGDFPLAGVIKCLMEASTSADFRHSRLSEAKPPSSMSHSSQKVAKPPSPMAQSSHVAKPPSPMAQSSQVAKSPSPMAQSSQVAKSPTPMAQSSLVAKPPSLMQQSSQIAKPSQMRESSKAAKQSLMISPEPQSSQEKQEPRNVSEMQQQRDQLQEDLKREREELKKKNQELTQSTDRIVLLEFEAEKAKQSEANLLESLYSQTKQLEDTKVLLEEAKLEIKNLQEKEGSLASTPAHEEIKMLREDIRSLLEIGEKNKKTMDDFSVALKELTVELAATKSEIVNAKASNFLSPSNEEKLLFYVESAAACKEKEDNYLNSKKSYLEELHKSKDEISKLKKMIIQALNESTVIKKSLELTRYENNELKNQLSNKEIEIHQIMGYHENVKVSEGTSLESLREVKNLPGSASDVDIESFTQSSATTDDRKITSLLNKHLSDLWSNMNPPRVQNGHIHSNGELNAVNGLRLKQEGDAVLDDGMLYTGADDEKDKKKTPFRKFGDAWRRNSS